MVCKVDTSYTINTLRPRQNGRHFADDILKCIFLNENVYISIEISLKFVPKGPINTIPALVQIMAWRRPGDKPLSESMMVNLPTHICVTRPHWVNGLADLSVNEPHVVCRTNYITVHEIHFMATYTHICLVRLKIPKSDISMVQGHMWTLLPEAGISSRDM